MGRRDKRQGGTLVLGFGGWMPKAFTQTFAGFGGHASRMNRNNAVHLSREAAQRELGALADRLARELVFGPDAKAGYEAVLDDGTRLVLAEDLAPDLGPVQAKLTLAPGLAARIADSTRYPPPPPQARFETPGDVAIEGDEP